MNAVLENRSRHTVRGNPHQVLRAALAILAERGQASMEEGGRRRCVAINPALLDGPERAVAIAFRHRRVLLLLLLHLPSPGGRDCVGAVQLLTAGEQPKDVHAIDAEPLSEAEVERTLIQVVAPASNAAHPADDDFRISIAGA